MDFRGASAEAVAALTDQLKAAVSASADGAAASADSLFSVSQTLRAEPALRRFLADGSMPAEAKTGLVSEVFGGKVDDTTLAILKDAAGRRWTGGRDLANGIERLSEVAAVLSAGEGSANVSDQLFELRRVIDDNPELRNALSDPARTIADKSKLLDGLLAGKTTPAVMTLAKHALAGTYGTVSAALTSYRTLAGDVRGEFVATVYVAKALGDDQAQRLEKSLAVMYGRPVHVNVVIEPSVLGGIRVEIGDNVIDGTVSGRLDDVQRRLAG